LVFFGFLAMVVPPEWTLIKHPKLVLEHWRDHLFSIHQKLPDRKEFWGKQLIFHTLIVR